MGVCNGFQALIKLGLVPYGEIRGQKEDSPTLTFNTIGRHISKMVYTKVVSNKSPWLALAELGKTYAIPASHGEGRFRGKRRVAEEALCQWTGGNPVMWMRMASFVWRTKSGM